MQAIQADPQSTGAAFVMCRGWVRHSLCLLCITITWEGFFLIEKTLIKRFDIDRAAKYSAILLTILLGFLTRFSSCD